MMRDDDKDRNYDSVADDAADAYREVMERTQSELIAPARADRSGESIQADDPAPVSKTADPATPAANGKERAPAPAARDDNRDDKGRFASKDGRPAEPAVKRPEKAAAQPTPVDKASKPEDQAKPEATPVAGAPPPSFSVKTKAEWDKLPEHVRADIVKRETEMQTGLSALRDYKDLKPWSDMAAQHGTTIGKALEHYTGLENIMRRDLAHGMKIIAQNFGYSQAQAAEFFGKLGAQLGGAAPNGQAGAASQAQGQPGVEQDPLLEVLRPILGPVMQEISGLKSQLATRQSMERNVATKTLGEAIEKFSSDPANRFYADTEETITRLFETGMVPLTGNHQADLKKAYDLALSMNPEIQQALIDQRLAEAREAERKKEQEAADKAKAASRSITGSRAPGTVIKDREGSTLGYDDIEADVRKAYRMHTQA
jgi:hypothetical protein